jgi:hypothetical protein
MTGIRFLEEVRCFSSLPRLDRLLTVRSLILWGIKLPEHEADYLSSCSGDVRHLKPSYYPVTKLTGFVCQYSE